MLYLTESGRLFHNIGVEKEKARSPYVTEFTVQTVKRKANEKQYVNISLVF